MRPVRYQDTWTDAEGHAVTDPRLAVRLDRDVYDDTGQLIRHEWYTASPHVPKDALRAERERRRVELEATAAQVHELAIRRYSPEEQHILELVAQRDGW